MAEAKVEGPDPSNRELVVKMVRDVEDTGKYVASLGLEHQIPQRAGLGEMCRNLRRFLKYYDCV